MTRVGRAERIEADIESVWQIIADLGGWPRWIDAPYASRSVAITSAGQVGPGCEFVLQGRLPFHLFARIVEWEPRRTLRYEVVRSEYPSDRLFLRRASAGFALEELEGGVTKVTYEQTAESKGPLGRLYMATVFRFLLRSNADRVLAGLQGAVEASTR